MPCIGKVLHCGKSNGLIMKLVAETSEHASALGIVFY